VTEPNVPVPGDVFHFENGRPSFIDIGQENGLRFWWWSDLQRCLGYSAAAGQKALSRAMTVCTSLDIPLGEAFAGVARKHADGMTRPDYKLTRFACYLVAMNADVRKPEVARAQAYFATLAQVADAAQQQAYAVDRVATREEVSGGHNALIGAAKRAGATDYAHFQNAGYRGLYNMNLTTLKVRKGVHRKHSLLDFMGRAELAANLFRITQTEATIESQAVHGQRALETTAERVGKTVRQAMHEISGTRPEDLPIESDIRHVKRGLKQSQKTLQKLDSATKTRRIVRDTPTEL
jgi:DNA-damage-inducible protein D